MKETSDFSEELTASLFCGGKVNITCTEWFLTQVTLRHEYMDQVHIRIGDKHMEMWMQKSHVDDYKIV